jgi:hypothetical protein
VNYCLARVFLIWVVDKFLCSWVEFHFSSQPHSQVVKLSKRLCFFVSRSLRDLVSPIKRRNRYQSPWPFDIGKELKETCPKWTPPWGVVFFGTEPQETNRPHSLCWSHFTIWFFISPLFCSLAFDWFHINLSCFQSNSAIFWATLSRRTPLPHSDCFYSLSNANPGFEVVFKVVNFRFCLLTPSRWLSLYFK